MSRTPLPSQAPGLAIVSLPGRPDFSASWSSSAPKNAARATVGVSPGRLTSMPSRSGVAASSGATTPARPARSNAPAVAITVTASANWMPAIRARGRAARSFETVRPPNWRLSTSGRSAAARQRGRDRERAQCERGEQDPERGRKQPGGPLHAHQRHSQQAGQHARDAGARGEESRGGRPLPAQVPRRRAEAQPDRAVAAQAGAPRSEQRAHVDGRHREAEQRETAESADQRAGRAAARSFRRYGGRAPREPPRGGGRRFRPDHGLERWRPEPARPPERGERERDGQRGAAPEPDGEHEARVPPELPEPAHAPLRSRTPVRPTMRTVAESPRAPNTAS